MKAGVPGYSSSMRSISGHLRAHSAAAGERVAIQRAAPVLQVVLNGGATSLQLTVPWSNCPAMPWLLKYCTVPQRTKRLFATTLRRPPPMKLQTWQSVK